MSSIVHRLFEPVRRRIARRLGVYHIRDAICRWMGVQPAMREIIVFQDREAARRAGFKGEIHPKHPSLRAYWPGLGARGLSGPTAQRITVTGDSLRFRTDRGTIEAMLRSRQCVYGEDAVWIEL